MIDSLSKVLVGNGLNPDSFTASAGDEKSFRGELPAGRAVATWMKLAGAFRLGTVLKAAGVKTAVFGAKETNHRKLNDNLGTTGDPATKVLQEFVDALLPE